MTTQANRLYPNQPEQLLRLNLFTGFKPFYLKEKTMDTMINRAGSRRRFIGTFIGLLPGILLASPKRLQAAKPGIHDFLRQMDFEILPSSRPERVPGVLCNTLEDTSTLYREKRGKKDPVCSMNPMGKTIWEACDGKNRPKEISQMIHDRYLVSKSRARLDTLGFLWQLKKIGAIQ